MFCARARGCERSIEGGGGGSSFSTNTAPQSVFLKSGLLEGGRSLYPLIKCTRVGSVNTTFVASRRGVAGGELKGVVVHPMEFQDLSRHMGGGGRAVTVPA